jgi:threonine aldolase
MNQPKSPQVIDLRSDTVTRPTPGMRKAMAEAVVGDDVLGDDPTVQALEERVASMLGHEAGCFVPSGTMANQVAIRAHTEPGDEVICHVDSHIINYETGGPAALSGAMVRTLHGPRGLFDAHELDEMVRPASDHYPRSRLVLIENTQNRGGGAVWPLDQVRRVTTRAGELGLRTHLDGARLWNACAHSGHAPSEFARCFDSVSCCFSKGLGSPAGSMTCGSKALVARIRRFRKMFGGAMRQSGVLAAAALYALDHHLDRLLDDHANASRLAAGLATIPGLVIPMPVETNIVFADLEATSVLEGLDAHQVSERLKSHGVLALPSTSQRLRVVCHLDVHAEMIDRAIDAFARVMRRA